MTPDRRTPLSKSSLYPWAILAIAVYGVVALECWTLASATWTGVLLLLALVIAVTLALVVAFDRLMDQPEEPAEEAKPAEPPKRAVPLAH